MCKGTNLFMDNSSAANRKAARFACLSAKHRALQLGTSELYVEHPSPRRHFVKVLLGMLRFSRCFFGDFLDSGHPALRRFAASSAVRAAPAAQCTSKESYPCDEAARKLWHWSAKKVTRAAKPRGSSGWSAKKVTRAAKPRGSSGSGQQRKFPVRRSRAEALLRELPAGCRTAEALASGTICVTALRGTTPDVTSGPSTSIN